MTLSISEVLRQGKQGGIVTETQVDNNMWQALGDFMTLVMPEIVASDRPPNEIIDDLMQGPSDDDRVALWAQLRSGLMQAMDGSMLHHDKLAVIASAAVATAEALEHLPMNDQRVNRFYEIFGCLPTEYLQEFCP